MYQIVLIQVFSNVLVICGFLLVFIFGRDLLLNSHTPTPGKTLGYIGALMLLVGLLVELVVYVYSVSNLEGSYSFSG